MLASMLSVYNRHDFPFVCKNEILNLTYTSYNLKHKAFESEFSIFVSIHTMFRTSKLKAFKVTMHCQN